MSICIILFRRLDEVDFFESEHRGFMFDCKEKVLNVLDRCAKMLSIPNDEDFHFLAHRI